jgi:hypothetical protein
VVRVAVPAPLKVRGERVVRVGVAVDRGHERQVVTAVGAGQVGAGDGEARGGGRDLEEPATREHHAKVGGAGIRECSGALTAGELTRTLEAGFQELEVLPVEAGMLRLYRLRV